MVRYCTATVWRAKWRAGGAGEQLALSAVGIKKAGPGRYGDGGGLELHKSETGGKWIWRYSFGGKRRQMGLGSYPAIGLADARKERDRWNYELQRGRDPITERAAQKAAVLEELNRDDPTLADLTLDVLEAKKRISSAQQEHTYCFGVHRGLIEKNNQDIREATVSLWQRMGLVSTLSEAHHYWALLPRKSIWSFISLVMKWQR